MWFLIAQMATQAFTAYSQGEIAAGEAKLNERVAQHNAMLADMDARRREVLQQEASIEGAFAREQAIGAARVRQGASGAATYTGAPVTERDFIGAWANLKNMQKVREIQAAVEDAKQQAASFRVKGIGFDVQAKSAKRRGTLNAATAVLGGLAKGQERGYWFQEKD
jgi:hypothetical protein